MFVRPESLLEDIDKVAERRDIGPELAASGAVLSSSETGQGLIMVATGRMPASFVAKGGDATISEPRQQAARSVVATWLLASDSSMYQILGVSPDCPSELMRENYRRLMGLVHPDTRPVGFPNDSASRVNFAYSIVSDEERRASYDASLALTKQQNSFPPQSNAPVAVARSSPVADERTRGLLDRIRAAIPQVQFGHGLLVAAVLILVPTGIALFSLIDHEARPQIIAARATLSGSLSGVIAPEKTTTSTSSTPARDVVSTPSPATTSAVNLATGPNSTANASSKATVATQASTLTALTPAAPSESTFSTSLSLSAEMKSPPVVIAELSPKQEAQQTTWLAPVRSAADTKTVTPSESPPVARAALRSGNVQTTTNNVADRLPPRAAPPLSAVASTPAFVDATARETRTELPVPSSPVRGASASSNTSVAAPLTESRVNASDADDILVKLSSAYESGSIAAFGKVFAPAMVGRRQVLSDYERVFQQTRQRSIRFTDFKHKVSGERLVTSGYAIVSTVDNDNHASSQRVFLEIDIGRAPEGLKIERLRNYPMN